MYRFANGIDIGVPGSQGGGQTVGQIAFPDTANPSTNANTLDDYEEGTWTPDLRFGGTGGCTYSTQDGTYQKIGNRVFASCAIVLSNNGGGTGSATIYGLPFTSGGTQSQRGGCMFGYIAASGAGANNIVALIETSATYMTLRYSNSGGTSTVDHSDTTLTNTASLYFVICYQASS